jgi:hypothetical protein
VETYFDDIQETIDAWHISGYSSFPDNGDGTAEYHWENPNGSGLFGGQPEINQQCVFLAAQAIINHWRPLWDTEANNRLQLYKAAFFSNAIWTMGISPLDRYIWAYSRTNVNQVPEASDCYTSPNPATFCAEDLGHYVLTLEFPIWAYKYGTGVFTTADMNLFARAFTQAIYLGSGSMSSTCGANGDPGWIDGGQKVIRQYGIGSFSDFMEFESDIAAFGRDVYDTENANTSGWQHKMYYNTGRQLYADNFNSLPAEEGGGGGGPSGSITPTLRLAG